MPERVARPGRYEMLDILRGVACLVVVAVHANHTNHGVDSPSGAWDQAGNFVVAVLNRGWVAVPAFFVISGYGISQAVDGLRRRERAARTFIERRSIRLFPPYLASTILFALTVVLADSTLGVSFENYFIRDPGVLSPEQWLGNYTLTETCRHHAFGPRSVLLADHYWTLNYELQFYAIVALVLLVARNWYFAIAALVTLAVVAVQFSPAWVQNAVEGFIVRRHWIVFAAGILLYWQICYATPSARWCCNLALLVVLVIALWDWELASASRWSPRAAVAFTAAFTLVLSVVHSWDGRVRDAGWLAPLAACGAFSYSIYLTHPLIVRATDLVVEDGLHVSSTFKSLVVVPAVVLVSIGAGYVFYWAVERHFSASPVPARRVASAARATAVVEG